MNIGSRIKERRKYLRISADELAARLGKDRSTIYRYESGFIENLPLDVLEPIAEALETTPAALMGWEEETNLEATADIKSAVRVLPKDVQEIVNLCMEIPGLAGDLKVIAQTIVNRRVEK